MLKNTRLTLLLVFSILSLTSFAFAQDGAAAGGSGGGGGGASGVALGLGIRQYTLGPGDLLDLRVFGEQQFDSVLEVNSDGAINVPFIEEPIPAQCRSLKEVREDVITALSELLRRPQISLMIKERRSRTPAVIYGAVKVPQQFQMYRRARLLELISYTGGFTDQASGTIQITHTEPMLCSEQGDPLPVAAETTNEDNLQLPYTVYQINDLKLGKVEANPVIRPGDVVRVDEAPPIYITGSVLHPQGVFLRDNMTLTRAIALVGGVRREAKEGKIKIYRQQPGSGEVQTLVANYDEIRKNKQPDIALQPYDVIDVGDAGVFTSKTRLKDFFLGLAGSGAGNAIGTITAATGARVIY